MSQRDDSTPIIGEVKLKPWVQAGLLVVFLALAAAARWMDKSADYTLGHITPGATVASLLYIVFIVAAACEFVSLAIQFTVRYRGGSPGEVTMLTSFVRVLAIVAIVVALIHSTGELKQVGTVVGAFAGMLLGWSLQAPVSGMAAWALIMIKRPFRIGDRVLFPSLKLVGDVVAIGLMYTKLNQVGGSIGSEEAIGRNILIPNAMLFSQVAINYTAKQRSPYILDEIVIRMTYDSDWDVCEKIFLDAAREVTGDIIRATGTEPYIRADPSDYGVFMRLRYTTLAVDRPRMSHEIIKRIFRGFQRNPRVDVAMPYIYSYHTGMEGTESPLARSTYRRASPPTAASASRTGSTL